MWHAAAGLCMRARRFFCALLFGLPLKGLLEAGQRFFAARTSTTTLTHTSLVLIMLMLMPR
jgi:hypothetical protein